MCQLTGRSRHLSFACGYCAQQHTHRHYPALHTIKSSCQCRVCCRQSADAHAIRHLSFARLLCSATQGRAGHTARQCRHSQHTITHSLQPVQQERESRRPQHKPSTHTHLCFSQMLENGGCVGAAGLRVVLIQRVYVNPVSSPFVCGQGGSGGRSQPSQDSRGVMCVQAMFLSVRLSSSSLTAVQMQAPVDERGIAELLLAQRVVLVGGGGSVDGGRRQWGLMGGGGCGLGSLWELHGRLQGLDGLRVCEQQARSAAGRQCVSARERGRRSELNCRVCKH